MLFNELVLPYFIVFTSLLIVETTTKRQLYIGGLFPLTGTPVASSGSVLLPACRMALEMVNNRTDVLPGYELKMFWNDTKCDAGFGINILFEYQLRRPPMIMLLGAACSSVTQAVAEVAWHWNIIQVSYASTASGLSNKAKYPLLYRVVSPDSAYNTARLKFFKFYKWSRIATLRQNEYVFSEVMSELHESLTRQNFTLVSSESFTNDAKSHLKNLKEKDVRIIVGMFYEDKARLVFCEAYKLGMYGANYVWLLLDWFDNHAWWMTDDDDVDCTKDQMSLAVTGYFSIESVNLVDDIKPGVSGMTSKEFLRAFTDAYGNKTDLYLPFAFDSVWVIALALHEAAQRLRKQNRTLDEFTYKDKEMADVVKASMESLIFQGVTGRIKFSNKGDRTRAVRINQLQNGRPVTVAVYDPSIHKITQNNTTPVVWQGVGPPSDGLRTTYEVVYIAVPLLWVIIALASSGVLLALGFLYFNIKHRNHSYIKLSSPNLNNVIILGAILIYVSIYLIAMDGRTVGPDILPQVCSATGFLLGIGYSLAVGAMFSKTWRVHQIFNKIKPKKKVFKDSELIGLVIILVLVDLIMFSLWAGVDPPKLELRTINGSHRISSTNTVLVISQYEHCYSKYKTTWLYIILGYKGLILLVGCFISWETRKVKVRALNDSRFVGLSVYNIVLAVLIGGPLTFLIEENRNALVAIYSLFVFFPMSVSLCLLFVPKIIKIRKHPEEFLRLQSLSALRVSSDYSNHSTSTTDQVIILRLQTELAQLKKELGEHKTANQSEYFDKELRFDMDADVGEPGGRRKQLTKRSHTCLNMMATQHPSPHRRCNTFSGPGPRAFLYDPDHVPRGGLHVMDDLKVENAGLRRQLHESSICEAGKMCKILYKNAELNRKIVELSMKQHATCGEDDTVTRLMKENNELKRQLGEVSILNSVWCDVTPRLKRKATKDGKGKEDLIELNKLLTVDLGGGRSSSFGPSRYSRPSPIGKSQSSLDLCEPKDDEDNVMVEGENNKQRADSDTGIVITVNDEKTEEKSNKYKSVSHDNDMTLKQHEKTYRILGYTATELRTPQNDGTYVEDNNNGSQSGLMPGYARKSRLQNDNEGFVEDDFANKTNGNSPLSALHGKATADGSAHGKSAYFTSQNMTRNGTNETSQDKHSAYESDKKHNYGSNSQGRELEISNESSRVDVNHNETLISSSTSRQSPIRRRNIVSEMSESGLETAVTSSQYETYFERSETHQTTEDYSRSKHRQRSRKDKNSTSEKVEKTFFV